MNRRGTLLLVHGGFHGSWCWREWQPALSAQGWRCRPVNLPGHGPHRLPPDMFARLGIGDYAAALARAAVDDGGGACVLVGHSLGGLVVQAAQEKIKPRAIVLLATSPLRAVAGLARPPVPVGQPVPPPSRREMVRRWYSRPAAPAFGSYSRVHRMLRPESPTALNDCYLNRIDVPAARCPVLVIGSTLDERHERGEVDARTARYHRDAMLYLDSNHGHAMCLEEDSMPIVRVITNWLAQTVPVGTRRIGRP